MPVEFSTGATEDLRIWARLQYDLLRSQFVQRRPAIVVERWPRFGPGAYRIIETPVAWADVATQLEEAATLP